MSRLRKQIDGENEKGKATSREDLLLAEFTNLAINRFTWTNLPNGLTSERLEEMLISFGILGAFQCEEYEGISILPIYQSNKINLYAEYDKYRVKGFNGYEKEFDVDEIVKLKNNPLGTEDMSTLQIYAKRVDDIERTQEVNLFQQRIPKIIMANQDNILTGKNIIKKITEFNFAIFTKEKNAKTSLKNDEILDTSAPYILDKLGDYENFTRNKVLTFLGINNANTDKKERLITNEVNANNDLIQNMLDMMYDLRTDFCKNCNEKFGTNIKVEKREVDLSGSIHNDITGSNGTSGDI